MTNFTLNLRLPIACFDLRYVLSTPRKPSAFEGMIVYLIDYCQKQRRFLSDTVPNVFKNILQVNDVDFFVEPAIEELFSASINVLHTSNYNVSRTECPISDIEITEVGQRLLREGRLPSAPHTQRQKLYYNFITEKIDAKGDNLDEYDYDRIGGVSPNDYENVFPEDILSQELWRRSGENDAEVTNLEQATPVTFRQKYNIIKVEVTEGKISCTSDDSNIRQFLESLDADDIHDIVLADAINWQGSLSSRILTLDHITTQGLYLPKDLTKIEGRKVPVTFHTPDCELNNIIPENLEIIASENEPACLDTTRSPARLILPLPWMAESNGISDLNSVYEIVNVRLLCKGEPLVIPMGVKLEIPNERAISMRRQIITALLDEKEGVPFALMIAENNASLRDLVVKKLRGMPNISKVLQQLRRLNLNIPSLLKLIFPLSELKDFASVQNAYSIIKDSAFAERDTKAFLEQLAVHTEAMPTPTLNEWTTKWSLVKQMAGKTPTTKDMETLYAFMPLVPDQLLKDNAALVRNALSQIGLSNTYAEICKELLATIKEDRRLSLNDFAFIVHALAENPMQKKALFCNIEKYVLIPQTVEKLEGFCELCQKELIPLPDNKSIFTEESFKALLQNGIPASLQRISQFQTLQSLNSMLKTVLDLAEVSTLEEYISLPQTAHLNELHKACESFMVAWKKATPEFKPSIVFSCEDILTIVGKIQTDASNNLRKFWVFDTSSLIHKPELLQTTTNNVHYIIPKIVIRELDAKKDDFELNEGERAHVRAAIRNIDKLQKNSQVSIEEGDLNLLAQEYQQNPTNDDWILSVAVAHKSSEVLLITDDNNLVNKAAGENIKVVDSKQCQKFQREIR